MRGVHASRAIITLLAVLLPGFAHALTLTYSTGFSNFGTFVDYVIRMLLGPLIPMLISVAVIYTMFGIVKFIRSAGDMKAREDGRKIMIVGVIGLFTMVTFWAFAKLLQSSFGF